MGVVSGCCKEVYRYPHNNYYFSLLHLYWLSLLLCSFLNIYIYIYIYIQYRPVEKLANRTTGTLPVQSRYGHGTVAVQSRFSRGMVVVRSRYDHGTVAVWSR